MKTSRCGKNTLDQPFLLGSVEPTEPNPSSAKESLQGPAPML